MFTMGSNRCRGLLALCISDAAKQMLLSNPGFIPHLIDGVYDRFSLCRTDVCVFWGEL